MAQAQIMPILCSEVLNLLNPPLSLSAENVKFGVCTLESDRFLTVCETARQSVAIVELSGPAVIRFRMSAEAAIMNPVSRVIALRAGNTLQIFNLENHVKIRAHTLSAPVLYWKWITNDAIVLVTAQSVLHWSIEGDTAPVKVFDRNPALGRIINYQVSADRKWCLLCGISAGGTPGEINGHMQLFNIEKATSQVLQGHSGTFTVIKVPGRDDPAHILSFFGRKSADGNSPKLFIVEVGRDKTAPGGVFRVSPQNVLFTPDATKDFVVTMIASKAQSLLYMVTKMGYLFLFDIFSGKTLYRTRITEDVVFASTEHTATDGILCVTRKGQVLSVSIGEAALVAHVGSTLRDSQLATELALRLNLLPGANVRDERYFTAVGGAGGSVGATRVAADQHRLQQEVTRITQELTAKTQELDRLSTEVHTLRKELSYLRGESAESVDELVEIEEILMKTMRNINARKMALLRNEIHSLNDQNKCVVCLDNDKSVVLMPCAHLCVCRDCSEANGIRICPICRNEVSSKISIFV